MKNKSGCKDSLEVVGRAKGYSKEELIANLPRHSKFHLGLLKQVMTIQEVSLRNSGTIMAKKFIRMMREVNTETYRAMQFTRTEINKHGVLYGIVLLKHHVMDNLLKYFHERWPQCIICIHNEHNQRTGIIDEKGKIREVNLTLEETVAKVSKGRPIVPYFEDIQFSGEEIFESLYNSQNIVERENARYFKSMIPDKCFDLPGMRNGVEKRYKSQNKKINEFF